MSFVLTETTLYPDDLLDGLGAEEGERQWWAVYTRVRQEKRLAEELTAYRVPFYLPLIRQPRLYRGRRFESQLPLFGSYVFLFVDREERVRSLATNRIAHALPAPDGRQLYVDLVNVRRLIDSEMPLSVEARLGPGRRVRVRYGCMAGLEGVVQSRCRKTRLVVGITFLQRGLSVEIDDLMLEPID